jgi:hypothetical protein
MSELLRNAFMGGNLIPTVLLILIVVYWITVIIGVIDLDFLDFDLEIEGGDSTGPFHALLGFLKIGDIPIMFSFSILILNFWIIAMFLYYLPITPGGVINTLLLLPVLILSGFITKFEILPFRSILRNNSNQENDEFEVLKQLCKLKCDVNTNSLGQAEIERDGASVIINVKPEFEEETFRKDEIACVFRKDGNRDLYYIIKVEGVI